jgi:hypothetical protein
LAKNLKTNYNSSRKGLIRIADTHDMTELPRIQNLLTQFEKDFDRLTSRIGQLADKRKAAIDREAAN